MACAGAGVSELAGAGKLRRAGRPAPAAVRVDASDPEAMRLSPPGATMPFEARGGGRCAPAPGAARSGPGESKRPLTLGPLSELAAGLGDLTPLFACPVRLCDEFLRYAA